MLLNCVQKNGVRTSRVSKESREVPQKILKKLDFNFKLDIIKSGFLILDS